MYPSLVTAMNRKRLFGYLVLAFKQEIINHRKLTIVTMLIYAVHAVDKL